jgi:hypothetical protein
MAESLSRLTPQTGGILKCPVRVVFTTVKELTPKSGKKFTMINLYLVDGSGDYTVAVRRCFGDEKQRKKLTEELRAMYFAGSAWLLSHVTGVEQTNARYMCVSARYTITFGQAGRTAKFTPILATDPKERQLPKAIEPRECLKDLLEIVDKTMVNFMGILVSAEVPSGQPNHPVKIVVADETGRIQVKCWGAHWAGQFAGKEGELLVGFNFWATPAGEDGSGGLRALASVEDSHLVWPALNQMGENGKGHRLLAEKETIMAQTTPCLTEESADTTNYEEGEACATVAALMELANKYYEPLPDTLFQVQGAFVTIPNRARDYLLTKARVSEGQGTRSVVKH